ncbi:MAG TPA: hypothetical protein VM183_15580 [Burkholderiales bacterium]|nr:hypothetical protein [Burkholderiales bacterium]
MALALAGAAKAQDTRELDELKRRVEELEKRSAPRPASNAFNPDISLILQGTAARSSQSPNDFQITGFAPSGGEVGPARRGFSLGESELVMSSNIDPYFRGQLVAAFTPENEVEVEEAFFQTLALGKGFTLKGGRFLSGIGYQNPIHQHAWDFQDAPLPYKAFLGGRLNDDGVQLKWVAPTELLVELGTELGRGRTFPATDPNRNRAGMWSLFGHVGGDVGAATAWRAGLSYLKTSPQDRAFTDAGVVQSFSGESKLWIADFVVKSGTNLKLQGEYFRRTEDGDLQFNGAPGDYASRQSGWYLQSVYQFMPRWRAGYRYDRLSHGTVSAPAGVTAANAPLLLTDHSPNRNTVMVDWSPTEFSRVRLQLASDKSRVGVTDNQVLLQYIFSLGAHGAHTF